MPDPSDNLPAQNEPRTTRFDHRPARTSGLAALAVVFAGAGYSRELGFMVYAVLFAIPHAVFVVARSSRKWQAWGLAIGWVTSAAALLLAAFTALKIMRNAQGPQIAMLIFLLALLLSQVAQMIFVRRAFPGKIAFGTPLFRVALYYVCVLLVVAATLPNWYVLPAVRRENKSVKSPRKDSSTLRNTRRYSSKV
jgi:ethanolamine transporter EutH